MPTLHFTTDIHGTSETIFALITNLTEYSHWLPTSKVFEAVTQVSSTPIGLGTTYRDGPMSGSITDYQPPIKISFQQSRPLKLLLLSGTLDINTRYTFETEGNVTHVNRNVTFSTNGVPTLVHPIIASTIRKESQRILLALKRYVESSPTSD